MEEAFGSLERLGDASAVCKADKSKTLTDTYRSIAANIPIYEDPAFGNYWWQWNVLSSTWNDLSNRINRSGIKCEDRLSDIYNQKVDSLQAFNNADRWIVTRLKDIDENKKKLATLKSAKSELESLMSDLADAAQGHADSAKKR